jgi:hypothetical protein
MTEVKDSITSDYIKYNGKNDLPDRLHIFIRLELNKVTTIEELEEITAEFKSYLKGNTGASFSSAIEPLLGEYWFIEFINVQVLSKDSSITQMKATQENLLNFFKENYFNFYHKSLI